MAFAYRPPAVTAGTVPLEAAVPSIVELVVFCPATVEFWYTPAEAALDKMPLEAAVLKGIVIGAEVFCALLVVELT